MLDESIWNIGKFEYLQCIEEDYIHKFILILKGEREGVVESNEGRGSDGGGRKW